MARSFVLSWDGECVAIGDPMNSKYAQHSLAAMAQLQDAGWQVSGLWTPAHCASQEMREQTYWRNRVLRPQDFADIPELREAGCRPAPANR